MIQIENNKHIAFLCMTFMLFLVLIPYTVMGDSDQDVTVQPTPYSMDFFGYIKDAKIGDKIVVMDADGIACGEFTINTDGPEMLDTSLRKERAFLLKEGLLNEKQLWECEENARKASFLK